MSASMQPMAVDLRILRSLLLPDTRIIPGRALMARVVAADGSGRGSLSIAGLIVDAELPREVRRGQDLRLVVREVSSERVLLGISDPAAGPAAAAAAPIPLPGGGSVAVAECEHQGAAAGGERHTLALRYDAPTLGTLDLRFELHGGGLRLTVAAGAGPALTLAGEHADQLRQELERALPGPVTVTVTPRREPLEVYA